jgi:uncharacterized protein
LRFAEPGGCEIAAPFGLDDLFALVVRPTPRFTGMKRGIYQDRVRPKARLAVWPHLRTEAWPPVEGQPRRPPSQLPKPPATL